MIHSFHLLSERQNNYGKNMYKYWHTEIYVKSFVYSVVSAFFNIAHLCVYDTRYINLSYSVLYKQIRFSRKNQSLYSSPRLPA